MDRATIHRTVYNTRRWQALRADHLARHPRCTRTIPAVIVHHKTPIRQGDNPWDPANLESLCQSCHNGEHNAPAPVPEGVRQWRERLAAFDKARPVCEMRGRTDRVRPWTRLVN